MKKNVFLITFLFMSISFTNNCIYAQTSMRDSLYTGIQDSIYSAFMDAFASRNTTKFTQLQTVIASSQNKLFCEYWFPYSKYYESVYYLKTGNKKDAKKIINAGVQMLENVKNKNSESYALLAHLMSFSIQFEYS